MNKPRVCSARMCCAARRALLGPMGRLWAKWFQTFKGDRECEGRILGDPIVRSTKKGAYKLGRWSPPRMAEVRWGGGSLCTFGGRFACHPPGCSFWESSLRLTGNPRSSCSGSRVREGEKKREGEAPYLHTWTPRGWGWRGWGRGGNTNTL